MAKHLPIHEMFYTWQGEGCHLGRAAYFIRTYGCPLHCPWCDSAGTWHKDYVPETIQKRLPNELADVVAKSGARFAVITGGEPAIQDLRALTSALHKRDIKVHIETSGAYELKGDFDWITVSPKRARDALSENITQASELKFIIEQPSDITYWREHVSRYYNGCPIWLHPEWTQHNNAEILKAISEAVKTNPDEYRAGYQLHKLYQVDALDVGSAPRVPLGGKPELGY